MNELEELHRQNAELKKSDTEYKQTDELLQENQQRYNVQNFQ